MIASSGRHAGKRLSPWRVSLAVLIVLVAAAGIAFVPWYVALRAEIAGVETGPRWFGGYFDATAAHVSEVPSPASEDERTVLLSFVVAAAPDTCTPSWGAAYSLAEAGREIDLDRRVDRLRRDGAHVAVSFGGAINTELASACSSVTGLVSAYGAVIDRYDLTTIDLDVEFGNLSDTAAGERRAQAVAELQERRRSTGSDLQVWLTLPVAVDGLTAEGLVAVEQMLAAGVDLAGVNVMTMNYGVDLGRRSLADVSIDALNATRDQLARLWDRHGILLPAEGAWAVLGATPMIGQNDVAAEVFTLADADRLNAFAHEKGLKRMSMWSLNRDRTCGPNYPNLTVVSDACSGVDQGSATFAAALSKGFADESAAPAPVLPSRAPVPDDPKTAPYPLWNPTSGYSAGVRVVWHGYVYQAKWWTSGGVQPDDPTMAQDQTPWVLVGPVMPDDEPFALPTVPPGTYSDWSADAVYEKGMRVVFEGTPYQAKWWTRGDLPTEGITDHDRSPWELLDEGTVAPSPSPSGAPSG